MSAINLTTGTAGVKQKDYRVYIETFALSSTASNNYVGEQTTAYYEALLAALKELGECRADSIDLGIGDGDSVDGNTLGKIVLEKTGTFSVELINATPANIDALVGVDGVPCNILLVERDFHSDAKTKTIILMSNVVVSYSEKITGGDIMRATLNVEKSVSTAPSFRIIDDVNIVD
jgi:hypothetical protein